MDWQAWWEVKQVDLIVGGFIAAICLAAIIVWSVFEKRK